MSYDPPPAKDEDSFNARVAFNMPEADNTRAEEELALMAEQNRALVNASAELGILRQALQRISTLSSGSAQRYVDDYGDIARQALASIYWKR